MPTDPELVLAVQHPDHEAIPPILHLTNHVLFLMS